MFGNLKNKIDTLPKAYIILFTVIGLIVAIFLTYQLGIFIGTAVADMRHG